MQSIYLKLHVFSFIRVFFLHHRFKNADTNADTLAELNARYQNEFEFNAISDQGLGRLTISALDGLDENGDIVRPTYVPSSIS